MKTKNTLILLVTVFFISFISCTKDSQEAKDTIAPVMTMEEPMEGQIFYTGDEFHMEMDLTDNLELMKCEVTIIADSVHMISTLHNDEPWTFTNTFPLSGTADRIHEHIIIPNTIGHTTIAKGRYLYVAKCFDKAGNVSKEEVKVYIATH